MRAFSDIHLDSSPKLVWLVTLLAAAAIILAPGTAVGAGETACGAEAQECVDVDALAGPVDTTVATPPTPPVATPPTPPVVPDSPPATGVSTDPPVGEPTTPPVVPTPRIDPGIPVTEPEVPALVATDPGPVTVAVPSNRPNIPLAPDSVPGQSSTPFVATATTPETPDVAPGPRAAPVVKQDASPASNRPDVGSFARPDAPPVATETNAIVAATPTSKIDRETFFGAGTFGDVAPAAAAKDVAEKVTAAVALTKNLEDLFSTSNEWTAELVGPSDDLLETLATYLIPGEGGSYTATLAALLLLALVLVALALLRPVQLSSPLSPLRSSQRAGYRAVVFRPG